MRHPTADRDRRCTADHEQLKSTDAWWSLALVGQQHTPEDEIGPGEDLELRNCACGSTLARVILMYIPTRKATP